MIPLSLILSMAVFGAHGAPRYVAQEECSPMDFVIDRHLSDFSEALESVLEEQNAFEMLRGEDEENFIFVQGCETIEKDLNVLTCRKLREKNRGIVRNCFKLDLVGTPLSYCIQRKLNANTVANRCVKTYLTSTDHEELKNLFDGHLKCLIDGLNEVCGEEAANVFSQNLKKIKYLKEIY